MRMLRADLITMTVAFLTRDFTSLNPLTPAGCAYYRCYLPAAVIRQRSTIGLPAWDPIRGFGVKETNNHGIFGYSTVVLKLLMDRWIPKQIELAQGLGQKIVVDLDDFYQGLTPANKAYELSNPKINKNNNRDFYEKSIMLADALIVSTPFLKHYYDQLRDNVYVVRNGVNVNQFTPFKHSRRKPVIGWTGSTEYRNNDLEILSTWLPEFVEKNDLHFHHAGQAHGAPNAGEVIGINPARIRTTPMRPITQYANGFQFDIGVVPLNNIPFNEAKSNIKGLEYASAGIPFIASDLPEYRTLHEAGVGRIANTPEQWEHHMLELLDRMTRVKEAQRGRVNVMRDWSIEARRNDWLNAFTSISQQKVSDKTLPPQETLERSYPTL